MEIKVVCFEKVVGKHIKEKKLNSNKFLVKGMGLNFVGWAGRGGGDKNREA